MKYFKFRGSLINYLYNGKFIFFKVDKKIIEFLNEKYLNMLKINNSIF